MKMQKFSKFKITIGVLGVLVALSFVLQSSVRPADAAVTVLGVSGFAWSDMPDTANQSYPSPKTGVVGRGAGWISFNNSAGTSAGYGGNVGIDSAGNLNGYAWTPNMGYIRFDPAGPYPESSPNSIINPVNPGNNPPIYNPPSGGGVGPVNPGGGFLPTFFKRIFNTQTAYAYSIASRIDLSTGKWSGFARACAVYANPSLCSGALASDEVRGGWDGWISLRGQVGNGLLDGYGVQSNLITGATSGWAWGGDVMGWITFENVQLSFLDICPNITGNQDQSYLTANGLSIDPITNECVPPTGNMCTDTIDNNANGLIDSADILECPVWCTDGIDNNANGLIDSADLLECPKAEECGNGIDDNGNGQIDEGCGQGTPVPSVDLTAAPTPINCESPGGTTIVSWTSSNATSCTVTQTAGTGFSGGQAINGSQTVSGLQDPGPFLFSISCNDTNPVTPAATDTATVSCQNQPNSEVCGNNIDDDGDGFVDEGCPGSQNNGLNPVTKER